MISEISFGCVSWQKCPAPFKTVWFCPFVPGHFFKNGLSIPTVTGSLSAKAHSNGLSNFSKNESARAKILVKNLCDDFEKIIHERDRKLAGYSVPAHGLFLKEINYNWDEILVNG